MSPEMDIPPRPEEDAANDAREAGPASDLEIHRELQREHDRLLARAIEGTELEAAASPKPVAAVEDILDDVVATPLGRIFWYGLAPAERMKTKRRWVALIRANLL